VYDAIAVPFDGTRHTPWPDVAKFVASLPPGTTLADIGCGNGRNMGLNPLIHIFGIDVSLSMVRICRDKNYRVCVGDALRAPFRSNSFDAALSIAVLHHLSTEERRIQALRELARCVRPGGRILVSAWAQEQEEGRWQFDDQDVWVPWRLHKGAYSELEDGERSTSGARIIQRYCHVYREGELEELVSAVHELRVDLVWLTKGNWNMLLTKSVP
jgi:SAM-dependent methyltransferase